MFVFDIVLVLVVVVVAVVETTVPLVDFLKEAQTQTHHHQQQQPQQPVLHCTTTCIVIQMIRLCFVRSAPCSCCCLPLSLLDACCSGSYCSSPSLIVFLPKATAAAETETPVAALPRPILNITTV